MKCKLTETEVSSNHCIFIEDTKISFAKDADPEVQSNKFQIIAYSGGLLHHFFWGNVAFDLTGTKFAKRKIPVLKSHDKEQRIGFTTKQNIGDTIEVEGEFVPNSKAQEIKADLQAGYPMEASVLILPSVIEYVKEGEKVEVNGKKLKGPGAVFRKAIIKEISMCEFGVDSNTKSLAADIDAGEKIKFNLLNKELNIMKVETFQEEQPELYAEIVETAKASGEKSERDMFSELKSICGEDYELLIQCYEEGKDKEEALQLKSEKLQAANVELQAKLEAAQKVTKTEVKKDEKKVDPAEQEFTDDVEKVDTTPSLKDLKGEELWKAEYAQSEEIQKEFGEEAVYVAFKKHDELGQVKLL